MHGNERRAAVAAYKERKSIAGVFAVRCAASGQTWVGGSRDPEASRNRIWFTLRLSSHPRRELQAAWAAHGEQSLSFETLERFEEDDDPAYLRDKRLQGRVEHWRAELSAQPL